MQDRQQGIEGCLPPPACSPMRLEGNAVIFHPTVQRTFLVPEQMPDFATR